MKPTPIASRVRVEPAAERDCQKAPSEIGRANKKAVVLALWSVASSTAIGKWASRTSPSRRSAVMRLLPSTV